MREPLDADAILARMRADDASDWPARLLARLADAPLVDESWLGRLNQPSDVASPGLNPSERRVVAALSFGLTAVMAGELLVLSPETVKKQASAARYKLRAKNTTHACCTALRGGIIQ